MQVYGSAFINAYAEEFFRGLLVPPALHQDIEHMAILVDGAPQVVAFAMNGEKHLIQVPRVPRAGTPAARLIGIGLPEFPAP